MRERTETYILCLILVLLTTLTLIFTGHCTIKKPTLYKDIETVRLIQRECLARSSPHAFGFTRAHGGFFITCTPIKE